MPRISRLAPSLNLQGDVGKPVHGSCETRQDGVRQGLVRHGRMGCARAAPKVPLLTTQPPGAGGAQCVRKARPALGEQELRALGPKSGCAALGTSSFPPRAESQHGGEGWALPAGWLPFLLLMAETRGQWADEGRGACTGKDPAGGGALTRC